MIKIEFKKNNNSYQSFLISGHSGLGSEGNDILCAAVSALSIATVNGITEVIGLKNCFLNSYDGYLELKLPENLSPKIIEKTDLLIETLYLALSQIQEDYQEFIKIKLVGE